MNKLFKHLKTIHTHRKWVRRICFMMGLYWQGLTHDLSKYSLRELKMCKYWTGQGSPHQACRNILGYSPSWIYHYHKNKHHYQYWWDEDEDGNIIPIKMPYKYVIEMFCDMIGASMAYNGSCWNEEMVLQYWYEHCKGKRIMNNESCDLLEFLFLKLKKYNLTEFIKYYKDVKDNLKKSYDDGTFVEIEEKI